MLGLSDGWLWAIGGLILLIAEMIAPGFFLIFIGAAAILTGVATLAFGLSLPLQLLVFVAAAGLAVFLGRRRYEEPPNVDLDNRLNNPGRRLEGKVATAVTTIDEHSGRVRLGDSEWTARGGPAAEGERVRVVAVDGNCLIVEPEVKKLPDES
jgi:membrane protein implicated in regulation of membrane protease activity